MKYYPKASRHSAIADASRLLGKPHVAKRREELWDQMVKRADITIDKVLGDLQVAVDMAKEQEKPADLTGASMAQAKVAGLLKDRVETTNRDFESMDSVSEIIEAVEREAGASVALALSKAMGVLPHSEETPPAPSNEQLEAIEPPTDAVN